MPKSKHLIPGRVRSTYEFIKAHRDRYRMQRLCRVLDVVPCAHHPIVITRSTGRDYRFHAS
jgi:hypothetical protein